MLKKRIKAPKKVKVTIVLYSDSQGQYGVYADGDALEILPDAKKIGRVDTQEVVFKLR